LKQAVIGTVNQDYFRGCLPQSLGGGQSSETAAHGLPVAIDVSRSSILFGYLCMQSAHHSQSIENTVSIFGNRASPSEK
jgi:hypothetical protein